MKKKSQLKYDGKEVWIVVDKDDKKVKSFRYKATALYALPKLESIRKEKLQIKHLYSLEN